MDTELVNFNLETSIVNDDFEKGQITVSANFNTCYDAKPFKSNTKGSYSRYGLCVFN